MNTFTIVATGQTTATTDEVGASVRASLAAAGVELIACTWAPDLDTIRDNIDAPSLELIDLN